MDSAAEKELVVLARQGDEKAFETLVELSLPKLKHLLAKHFVIQPADVNDIIQAAMIKAWKKLSAFRNESAFTTWFYIILRNEAIDFCKQRNILHSKEVSAHFVSREGDEGEDYESLTHELALEQPLEETAASMVQQRELMEFYRTMIEEVLNTLSPSHGQIIRMALQEGRTYKEIADTLGIPVGTVMSRLFFARKQARNLIIQYARRNAVQLTGVGRC